MPLLPAFVIFNATTITALPLHQAAGPDRRAVPGGGAHLLGRYGPGPEALPRQGQARASLVCTVILGSRGGCYIYLFCHCHAPLWVLFLVPASMPISKRTGRSVWCCCDSLTHTHPHTPSPPTHPSTGGHRQLQERDNPPRALPPDGVHEPHARLANLPGQLLPPRCHHVGLGQRARGGRGGEFIKLWGRWGRAGV